MQINILRSNNSFIILQNFQNQLASPLQKGAAAPRISLPIATAPVLVISNQSIKPSIFLIAKDIFCNRSAVAAIFSCCFRYCFLVSVPIQLYDFGIFHIKASFLILSLIYTTFSPKSHTFPKNFSNFLYQIYQIVERKDIAKIDYTMSL